VEAPVETLPLRRLTVFYIDREYPRKRRIATALVLVRWQGKALWYTVLCTILVTLEDASGAACIWLCCS
jgi:hypothetical protein